MIGWRGGGSQPFNFHVGLAFVAKGRGGGGGVEVVFVQMGLHAKGQKRIKTTSGGRHGREDRGVRGLGEGIEGLGAGEFAGGVSGGGGLGVCVNRSRAA